MGRVRFVVGALGTVAGFFVYQCGLFLMLNLSGSLTAWIKTFVPWILSDEILGAALQLVGGTIAIAGLLVCISWIGAQPRAKEPATKLKPVEQVPDSARKCRFCGAVMAPNAVFCPSCQRAQA